MQYRPRANRVAGWLMMTIPLLLLAAAPSLSADQPIRVAFIGSSADSSHLAPVHAGVMTVAEEAPARGARSLEVVNWTPVEPVAALQAEALRRAFIEGLDGVILSPVDSETLAPVIKFLIEQNIAVVTVNGDSAGLNPAAHSGATPTRIGQQLADQLIHAMGRRTGPVAILAGNPQSHRNAQMLQGVTERLEAANIPVHGIYDSREDASAVTVVKHFTREDRDRAIRGWIFLGPWPLSSGEAMPWLPRQMPAVAADVIPIALSYVDNQQVAALVAEDYFSSGQHAARMILRQINGGSTEPDPSDHPEVWIITPDNITEHRQKWVRWMQ